jgi:YegS/Rv2252/BmrU family lipid kinase
MSDGAGSRNGRGWGAPLKRGRLSTGPGQITMPGFRIAPPAADRVRSGAAAVLAAFRRMPVPLAALYFVAPSLRSRTEPERAATQAPSSIPTQARLIVNPLSGGVHGPAGLRELEDTVTWLGEHGLPTELCLTDGPGAAMQLAAEAVNAGMRMVIAAGGDGTINEVIQALAGHTTALGVLPVGTVNVWAREAGIPLSLAEARVMLVEGVQRRIDLGRAGTRYFLLMAGIGIDAATAKLVEHRFLKRIGLKMLDYIATSGYLSVRQRPVRVRMTIGSRKRTRHAVQIMIGNTRLLGGALAFTRQAVADDGWLDLVFVGGHRLRHRAQVLLRAALRRPSLGPHAHYELVRTVRLESDVPLPVQVDGEVIGTLPMTFAVVPRALSVVVPAGVATDLFLHPPLPRQQGSAAETAATR